MYVNVTIGNGTNIVLSSQTFSIMICGIFGICDPSTVEHWEASPLLDFVVPISENTGEVFKDKKETTTKNKGLTLKINKGAKYGQYATISGSLHREAHGVNHTRFTFSDLSATIDDLRNNYGIDPTATALHSLEIELNLYLKYSPQRLLKAAITHKRKPFMPFVSKDYGTGKQAVYDDHIVKLYDKGKQAKQKDEHILRFGVKVTKMRFLSSYDIKTLADLQNPDKVASLATILFKAVSEIIFFDYAADTSTLSEVKALKWQRFSNPNYWERLDYRKMLDAQRMFTRLSAKIKATDYNRNMYNWIAYELTQIFEAETIHKMPLFTPFAEIVKQLEIPLFTHFKCRVQTTAKRSFDVVKNPFKKDVKNTPVLRRFCVTCGREITEQRKGSKFCSEKLHGKEAKRCRNKHTNQQRKERNEEQRTKELEQLEQLKQTSKNYSLTISLRTNTDIIKTVKVKSYPYQWDKIDKRKIIAVRVHNGSRPPLVLHSLRGRAYIDYLNKKQNINN